MTPHRFALLIGFVAVLVCTGCRGAHDAVDAASEQDEGVVVDAGLVDEGVLDGGSDASSQASIEVDTGTYVAIELEDLYVDGGQLDGVGGPLDQLVSRSYIHGLSLEVSWANLEPTQDGGYATTVLSDVLTAIRTVSARQGKTVTVKVHLRNGVVPDWLSSTFPTDVDMGAPARYETPLGFYALGQRTAPHRVFVENISTEPGYVTQSENNTAEVARQIEVADPANAAAPNDQLVKIVQLSGPSSCVGGTMILDVRAGFPGSGGGTDAYGFGWTFDKYIQSWLDAATFFTTDARTATFRTRQWTFDLTAVGPNGAPGPAHWSLNTTQQMPVLQILEANHPLGGAAVRLMDESVGAQQNKPDYPAVPTSCNWVADEFSDPVNDAFPIISARPLHEYQAFVSDVELLPRFETARNTLFTDPKDDGPTGLQHTQFFELHVAQVLGDDETLADGSGPAADWYTCFDSMIRAYASPARTLDADDQSFWSGFPSMSNAACGTAYPTAPASSVCAPP